MSTIPNRFGVRPRGDTVAIYDLPLIRAGGLGSASPGWSELSIDEAINMAVWLVSVAGHVDDRARYKMNQLLDKIMEEEAEG